MTSRQSGSGAGRPHSFGQAALDAWALYTERRVLIIFALGFSAGLPLALTGSALTLWMADAGVSKETIGLFALVGAPYNAKFLWAPFVDRLRLPFLTRVFGRRRGWLLASQLMLLVSIVALGLLDPARQPELLALAALWVTFASATQDIVIDAFRIESLDESRQAAGMANYVAAYRVALLVGFAGVAWIAQGPGEWLVPGNGWTVAYVIGAALGIVGIMAALIAREPEQPHTHKKEEDFASQFRSVVVDPFADFIKRDLWLVIILFILFFKLGDAFAGHMLAPFAIELGFDKATYAGIAGTVGLVATLLGGFIGGELVRVLGYVRALWVAGVAQMVTNFVFCWLAVAGPDEGVLAIAIGIESFAGGLGTIIFVGLLSSLCQNRAYTATQFALLTAVATLGRTVLTASSGYVAAATGWVSFFILTAFLALPGLALLWWLGRRNALNVEAAAAPAADTV